MSVLLISNDPARDRASAASPRPSRGAGVALRSFRADRFPVGEKLTVHLDADRPERVARRRARGGAPRRPGRAPPRRPPPDVAVAIMGRRRTPPPCSRRPPSRLRPPGDACAPIKPRRLALARGGAPHAALRSSPTTSPRCGPSNTRCGGRWWEDDRERYRAPANVDGAEVGGHRRRHRATTPRRGLPRAPPPDALPAASRRCASGVTVVAGALPRRGARGRRARLARPARPSTVSGRRPPRGQIARALLAYCDRIGVQLVAFDLVEDADGVLWFIEGNTTAYYHFIEQAGIAHQRSDRRPAPWARFPARRGNAYGVSGDGVSSQPPRPQYRNPGARRRSRGRSSWPGVAVDVAEPLHEGAAGELVPA